MIERDSYGILRIHKIPIHGNALMENIGFLHKFHEVWRHDGLRYTIARAGLKPIAWQAELRTKENLLDSIHTLHHTSIQGTATIDRE